jgi:hypothetical protein
MGRYLIYLNILKIYIINNLVIKSFIHMKSLSIASFVVVFAVIGAILYSNSKV